MNLVASVFVALFFVKFIYLILYNSQRQGIVSSESFHAQKTTSPRKVMCGMWATIYLAKEVGKGLGASTVL